MMLGTTIVPDKATMMPPNTTLPKKETVGWGAWYFLAAGFVAFALLHEYLYREQRKRR